MELTREQIPDDLMGFFEPSECCQECYVCRMVAVFREVRRVLRDDGTLWLNLGDSYAASSNTGGTNSIQGSAKRMGAMTTKGHAIPTGLKPKDLVGIPWRVAFALQADGWYLRSDIIWAKPNPMPESVTDRPTKSHEYLFLLSKAPRYFYDADAVREDGTGRTAGNKGPVKGAGNDDPFYRTREGFEKVADKPWVARNRRTVWTVATQPYGNIKRLREGPVPDAGVDDSDRIASPDCPVHAGQRRPASMAGRDGQPVAFGSHRSPGTGRRRGQEQPDELAPIDLPLDVGSEDGSSGSPHQPYATAATPHSTESHRTDPDPETSPPCTPSGETLGRTGDTSTPPASSVMHRSSPENRTVGLDESSAGTSERSPDRSSCTCSWWESLSHFAVMPEALVEPCILAGTSERGVCPTCGSPWERVVEREASKPQRDSYHGQGVVPSHRGGGDRPGGYYPTSPSTTGWRATCDHDAEPVGALVLDPFGGSGTVARVANRLSRRAILIDLNPDYLAQQLERNRDMPLGLTA